MGQCCNAKDFFLNKPIMYYSFSPQMYPSLKARLGGVPCTLSWREQELEMSSVFVEFAFTWEMNVPNNGRVMLCIGRKHLACTAGMFSWKLSCPSADEKPLAIIVETVEVLESGRAERQRLLNSLTADSENWNTNGSWLSGHDNGHWLFQNKYDEYCWEILEFSCSQRKKIWYPTWVDT